MGTGIAAPIDSATPNWLYQIESYSLVGISSPGVVRSPDSNLYVTNQAQNTILQITPAGLTSTFAGAADSNCASIDGEGAQGANTARFCGPTGITVDSSGSLYVTDQGSNTIRKITSAGVVTTLAGVADILSCASIDGQGPPPGNNRARFCRPTGIAIDPSGSLYVTDKLRNTIRKIASAGGITTVTTLAGVAHVSCDSIDGEGNPGYNTARFCGPRGIAVDPSGTLYVADQARSTIRKITITPTVVQVSTVVGTGSSFIAATTGPLPDTCVPAPVSVAVIGGNQLAITTVFDGLLGANLGAPFNYAFSSFRQPVDPLPTINLVKAGSAVPVKFSLKATED